LLNSIDLIPNAPQAHQSQSWQQKDLSKVKDLSVIAKTTDWSFSSPYKGSVSPLSKSIEKLASQVKIDQDLKARL
jgi:hypothetical protein